jgi:hypothetical protein
MTARMRFSAICLLAIWPLSACALWPFSDSAPRDNEALLGPDTAFAIPPPAAIAQTVDVAQSIVAHFHGESYALDAQFHISPQEIDLVALDGMGRRALTATWKDGAMTYTAAPWLPPQMRPADILADILIVYAPDKTIAAALATSGAALTTTDTARRISQGGHDVMTIEYAGGAGWNRSAKLSNLAFGYEIDVQSAELPAADLHTPEHQ